MRKIFAWTVILALFAVTACSGKKTNAAQNADEGGKTAAVTENLRLRTDDRTTSEVVATLAAGTRVEILAVGRGNTIDGIASNWVRVSVLGEARDRDGKAVAAGTEGWLFGGYLSAAEDAESKPLTVSEEYADEKMDALIRAAMYHDTAEIRRLIADGADVNAKDAYGRTALIYAAYWNDVDMAKLLLEAGADVNARTKDGKTALMWSVNSLEMAELLRAAGAR